VGLVETLAALTPELYVNNIECVQDKSGLEMQLGVTAIGLVVFQNNARVNTFSWSVAECVTNIIGSRKACKNPDLAILVGLCGENFAEFWTKLQ